MINYGYINSGEDSRDIILDDYINQQTKSLTLPDEYDFTEFLNIYCKDQKNKPHCVPYSIGLSIETRKKLNSINDFWIDTDDIFSQYGNENGMMIRDALKYIKNIGYKCKNSDNREQILSYGKLHSFLAVKQSVYINGPCIIGLPVRNEFANDFWNGSDLLGGHAIACVGWTTDSFILMNSWGSSFGFNGKCYIPFDEFNNNVLECWTFIS